jgi:hypothetical protein
LEGKKSEQKKTFCGKNGDIDFFRQRGSASYERSQKEHNNICECGWHPADCPIFWGRICFQQFPPLQIPNWPKGILLFRTILPFLQSAKHKNTITLQPIKELILQAIAFGNEKRAEELMETEKPREMKRIGRRIEGFDEIRWRKISVLVS